MAQQKQKPSILMRQRMRLFQNGTSKICGAMSNATYETELLIVINSVGAEIRSEYWQRTSTEA